MFEASSGSKSGASGSIALAMFKMASLPSADILRCREDEREAADDDEASETAAAEAADEEGAEAGEVVRDFDLVVLAGLDMLK